MISEERTGVICGISAYIIWGLFPLYFVLFARSGAIEIVAHRALWSLMFCLALLLFTKSFSAIRHIFANPRLALILVVSGFLIAGNWAIYIFGVATGRTLDAALGYFTNPLVVTVLGVVVLGEQVRPMQWISFCFGVGAVLVLGIGYGQIPWVTFGLTITFGTYSLTKKLAGRSVAPIPGLAFETGAIAPIALIYLVFLYATKQATVPPLSGYALLVISTGIVTAIPLLLFAFAAKKVTLVTIGMIQYLAPIGQFLIGWLVFHEPMPLARWAGFTLIWIAIIIFLTDALYAQRRINIR